MEFTRTYTEQGPKHWIVRQECRQDCGGVVALSQDRLDGDGLGEADPSADIRSNRRIRMGMQAQ
jgi:hypothetical protein